MIGPAEPGYTHPAFANSHASDQSAFVADWTGSTLFVISYVNLY